MAIDSETANRDWDETAQAGACTKHNDLAWLHSDGSVTCMFCLVVETSSADCTFGEMPARWLAPKGDSGSKETPDGQGQ